jgi:hypothetical protein
VADAHPENVNKPLLLLAFGERSIDPDVTERHQRVEIDLVGEFVPVGYVGETKIPADTPVPDTPVPESLVPESLVPESLDCKLLS